MPNINDSVEWAIAIAEDDTHGYSQSNRYSPDYDCSSFVAAALIAGGFNVPQTMWTGNERSSLLNAGFYEVPVNSERQRGDIFLVHIVGGRQHTLICVDSANVVEAYSDFGHPQTGDQNGNEIRVAPFYNFSWQYHFRFDSPVVTTWHNKRTGGYSIDSVEAKDNALMTKSVLSPRGWSVNAISALLGNIGYESGYNPWRWQSDDVLSSTDTDEMYYATHGYGLLQYTPAARYTLSSYAQTLTGFRPNYADAIGSVNDGTAQLIFCDTTEGYYPTQRFPMSFDAFKASSMTAAYLAEVWLYNYERPADPSATVNARRTAAEYWYNVLSDEPTTVSHRFPVWMMIKPHRRY